MDALVAGGPFIAGVATWYVWRRFDWGPLVPGAMVVLVAVTVLYVALSTPTRGRSRSVASSSPRPSR